MPNFEFTPPLYLALHTVYCITSSISVFDMRIEQAKMGRMGKEMQEVASTMPPIPFWVNFVHGIDWLNALVLFILNWKITLIVWVIRFILKVVPVLETLGNLFMRPFRSKLPNGVSELHLAVARDLKILGNTSTENKEVWKLKLEKTRGSFAKLNCDENAIKEALDYLNADDYSKQDATGFCQHQRERIKRQDYMKKLNEQMLIEEEEDRQYQEKIRKEIESWDEEE